MYSKEKDKNNALEDQITALNRKIDYLEKYNGDNNLQLNTIMKTNPNLENTRDKDCIPNGNMPTNQSNVTSNPNMSHMFNHTHQGEDCK